MEAGELIRSIAGSGGRFIFGAGHPGALLAYYLGLARWVEELWGEVLVTEARGRDEQDLPLDWMGKVAVMGDGASMLHTHDPAPIRYILEQAGTVDLVVADHGFAGAALAVGILTVAIMETNDPVLAVVAGRGAEVTVTHGRQSFSELLHRCPRSPQDQALGVGINPSGGRLSGSSR